MPIVRRKAYTVDFPRLLKLWHDPSVTRTEVARELSLTRKQLDDAAAQCGLQARGFCQRVHSFEEPNETDQASEDSLALSPWVVQRIRELRLGMPPAEASHPDVIPWFHEDADPGPYTDDPEEGYPYDE